MTTTRDILATKAIAAVTSQLTFWILGSTRIPADLPHNQLTVDLKSLTTKVRMLTTPIPELCIDGNMEAVRKALASGEDVNTTNQAGTTGLMLAVLHKHNGIVEMLLRQPGLDVNFVSNYGTTALQMACSAGNVVGLRMLLGIAELDLDIGSLNPTAEIRSLIEEERHRRKNEKEAMRLKRKEKEKKKEEEYNKIVKEVMQVAEEKIEVVKEDCSRRIENMRQEYKDLAEECKWSYEEKERKQEERIRDLELTINEMIVAKEEDEEAKRKEIKALELTIEEMRERQKKAESQRAENFSESVKKLEEIKTSVKDLSSELLKERRINDEHRKKVAEEIEKGKAELATRISKVKEAECKTKIEMPTNKPEAKEIQKHGQIVADTLQPESEDKYFKVCASLKAEYDNYKQTQSLWGVQLKEIHEQNEILSKRLTDTKKDETGERSKLDPGDLLIIWNTF